MQVPSRQSLKSYLPLIPWLILAGALGIAWIGVHLLLLTPAQVHLSAMESEHAAIKQKTRQRLEAKATAKDMAYLFSLLPTQRDFAQLPDTISEEASRNGVRLPALSYSPFEKSEEGLASKAVFRGPATGRYEDLRRFIYGLESSGRLVFIDDLDVSRSGKGEKEFQNQSPEVITVNLQMSTYVKKGGAPPSSASPGARSSPKPAPQDKKKPGKEAKFE
jgi:Tfp pilus assembly protein PilO